MSMAPPPGDWEEAILLGAEPFMNAEVCFYQVDGDDNDWSSTSNATITILWRGKARVQQLRAPRDTSAEYQTSDSRSFRFQLDPRDDVPAIYSGAKARVINGGRDSDLENLSFVVDSAINSSHMAVRTVELTANLRPMAWAWQVRPELEPGIIEWPDGRKVTLTRIGNIVTAAIETGNMTSTSNGGNMPWPDDRFLPASRGNYLYSIEDQYFLTAQNDFFGSSGVAISPVDLGPYPDAVVSWVAAPEVI